MCRRSDTPPQPPAPAPAPRRGAAAAPVWPASLSTAARWATGDTDLQHYHIFFQTRAVGGNVIRISDHHSLVLRSPGVPQPGGGGEGGEVSGASVGGEDQD